MKNYIYLDNAAATPMAPVVLEAMLPYFADLFYNPSALYGPARQVAKDVSAARSRVAHWLGARPSEIIFTAGGTEANNIAIRGIMDQFTEGEFVTLNIEHEAVLVPSGRYATERAKIIGVNDQGIIDLDALRTAISDKTVMISVMYVNNEIGVIQPLRQISAIINEERDRRKKISAQPLPLYLHTDASQAAAYLDLHVHRLGVDLMTLNGGKIYGPKQAGALFVKSDIELMPYVLGGGQERGIRSGTENVSAIMGFAKALDMVQQERHKEAQDMRELQQYFIKTLKDISPDAYINGSLAHRVPSNVHVTFPGRDNERMIMLLEDRGILCAAGSACSAMDGEPSHVLAALGLDDQSARSSLRFTFGHSTTMRDVEYVIHCLKDILS